MPAVRAAMVFRPLSFVLLGALTLLGCDRVAPQARARLDRDVAKSATAGEPYRPTAAGKLRLTQGEGTFKACAGQPADRVAADGTVNVIAREAGAFHMCVEVEGLDGSRDRHEWDVEVAPRPGESPAELTAKIEGHREKVRSLGRSALAGGPRPCSKETVAAFAAEARPPLLDPGALDTLAGKQPKPDVLSRWRNEDVKALLSTSSAPLALTVRHLVAQRHVLITSVTTLRMPQMIDRTTFEGGVFVGTLHLVDLEQGKSLCSVPLTFRSSESLVARWDEPGPIETDFLNNGETAIRAATASLVPGMVPGMYEPR